MAAITTYLSAQSPGQTAFLLAVAPGFAMTFIGFLIAHVMDVRPAKACGR